MATLYARMTSGETLAEETVLCQAHLPRTAEYTAADAVSGHELVDAENTRLSCQVCGVKQDGEQGWT